MVFVRDALPAGVLEACEFVFKFRHPDDVVIIAARFVNKQRAAATEVGSLPDRASRLPACRIWESSTGKMPVGRDRWKRILLFEGKLDWFFFLTRDELISLNDSSTGIPTQDRVVLT